MPRLSTFIRENREAILAEWERFARELPSGASMDAEALRDHADAMLTAIALDLETRQTEPERKSKSHGEVPSEAGAEMTAASRHGLGRAESGFSIESMFAEFRALRASVISLWREKQRQAGPEDLEDLTRLNEAIDQAIAESITEYSREVEAARDRFLAVLGHDLRTPLGAILTSSQFLSETGNLDEDQRRVVSGMQTSGRRMIELVQHLLDLALTRLGSGIPLKPAPMDLGVLLREVAAEVAASHPRNRIDIQTTGSLGGTWDRARLAQALSNLVGNAAEHGASNAPITIAARGDQPDRVTVSVMNEGPPISRDRLEGIFEAMKGGDNGETVEHLGLGLYIVDRIVKAHGGSIDVSSSQGQKTAFTVTMPRRSVVHSARKSD